ncbi:MAG: hypothetical protein ACKVPY_14295 [Paracoccaceae bacterium]
MRRSIAVLALTLSACAPAPYEVGGAAGGALLPPGPGPVNSYGPSAPITSGPITAGPIGSAPAAPYAAAGAQPAPQPAVGAPLSAVAPAPVYPAESTTASSAAVGAGASASHAAISDEQDFSAVASRETIESDKQRMAENRAQYQQIAPGALPERSGSAAPSPAIDYAIGAPNRLGQAIWPRSGLVLANHDRACGRYDTPTLAQEAFLRSGGPRRDPKNLDPDGDGFACTWDPTPFQAAKGAGAPLPLPGAAAALPGQGG